MSKDDEILQLKDDIEYQDKRIQKLNDCLQVAISYIREINRESAKINDYIITGINRETVINRE